MVGPRSDFDDAGDDEQGAPTQLMSSSAYLRRIGISPEIADAADRDVLARLQVAHVTAVPFETLDITGDPHGEVQGSGVVLSVPHLYDKIVRRRRGGYCFELNGLFYWLLDELGYGVDRVAARVVSDGAIRTPANHHAILVHLERSWLLDVGMGPPMLRTPLPLNGTPETDSADVAWRVVASERPDASCCVQYRGPGDETWNRRYVFDDEPRSLSYFRATNDYLQSAPESPFTGEPFVGCSTDRGYRTLSSDTLTEVRAGIERELSVSPQEWHDVLEDVFGLRYPDP